MGRCRSTTCTRWTTAVIEALTQVKGIGRWTAEMFLMFRLHRPDVLPVGDLGIVKAVQRAYGLRKAPDPRRLTRIGEPWRPVSIDRVLVSLGESRQQTDRGQDTNGVGADLRIRARVVLCMRPSFRLLLIALVAVAGLTTSWRRPSPRRFRGFRPRSTLPNGPRSF